MRLKKTEFIIDSSGNMKSVVLDFDDYLKIMEIIEEVEKSKKGMKVKKNKGISFAAYRKKHKI